MKKTREMILTAIFAALTAVGGFLKVPAGPRSFTMQVFFTCMAGLLLGPYWGSLSQLIYVLLGLVGLPIFKQGGGLMYVVKPSFGFLIGLIPMAFIVGLLTRRVSMQLSRPKQFLRLLLAQTVGLVVLYVIGLPYMYLIMKLYLHKSITVWMAVKAGMLVYLPGDAVKIALTVLLYKPLRRAIRK